MQKEQPDLTNRIMQDPEIMVGKPVVKGTRIPVERVIAHLAHNPDRNDLFAAYPELTVEDVKACLAYAHAGTGAHTASSCFRLQEPHAGVIYPRLGEEADLSTKISRLDYVLTHYADRLDQFLVVTPHRVRIRTRT
jgi:uncharacterized protein (DUF433 family)